MIRKFLNPSGKLTYEEALRQAGERVEKERKDYLTTSNDNTWVERRNGKQKNKHLKKRGIKGAKSHALWKQEHPILNAAGTVASAVPLAVAAYPLVAGTGELVYGIGNAAAATTAGKTLLPWINAGLTSYFGAHGLNHAINEGVNGWGDAAITALEVAPLGRLVKPIYEGVVQPGMRLFNSPLTGNWTKIGNRQYRLSPNSLGANGSSVEQRIPQITADNAASMTPEQWTVAQDAAIARGDMAEAQRLRDLHFKVSAPKTKAIKPDGQPLALYHGTGKKFNYFDDNKIGTNYLDLGYYGRGHYFTPFKDAAEGYASVNTTPVVYKVYGNFKNPKVMSLEDESMIGKAIKNNDSVIAGMDDIDYSEYVSKTGKQLKSADAVTYDDKGVRIPLGERDNFNINDIRYYESPNREAMKGIKYIEQTPSATSLDAEQQLVQRLKSYTPKIGENGLVGYKPLNSGDVVNIPEEAIERQIQRYIDAGMTRENAIEYLREQFGYGAMTQNGKTFLLPEKYMITNPEYMKAHDAIHRVLRFDDSFNIPGAEGLNPNEAVAMISGEIKPALGIRANEPLTEEMLDKWLKTTNEKITGRYGFSSKIKDKKKFLKWANITAPAILPFGIGLTGYGLYNLFNQPLQQSLYYKQGGKMIYKFKKGNKIHIKKANRGKFTDYCGGKVTNECILRGKNSSDPAVRKRATFAANARKWNHKKGGIIVAGDGIKLGNIFSKALNFLNSDLGKNVVSGITSLYSGIKQSNNLRKQEEQLLKDYNYISKQINTLDVINKTNQLFQELQLLDPNIHVSEIDWRNLYGKNEGIAKQLAQANARNYLVNARQLMMLLNSQSSGGGLDFSGLINTGMLLLAGNKNKTNTGTTNTTTTNTQIPSTATPTYFSSSFDWSKPTLASAIKFST